MKPIPIKKDGKATMHVLEQKNIKISHFDITIMDKNYSSKNIYISKEEITNTMGGIGKENNLWITGKFRNGDMVVHTVSEKDGQVINNSYVFNRQSWCWKVQVRMKGVETKDETEKIEKSRLKTSFVKFGKLIENIPETFNEFELEKR